MSFPIVNTPFARNFVAAVYLHFFSTRGILLHPEGWPGTTPVSQALPWALAWSTILCGPAHTCRLSLNSRDRWHLHSQRTALKRRTACPSSDDIKYDKDGSCSEDRRGCCSPWTTLCEGPTTRELALLRVNNAAELLLTVPCSS